MKKKDHIAYWLKSAEQDLAVVESLFQAKQYSWCLFVGHLVLEKTLKAIFVDKVSNEIPPKTHNLLKIAELAQINLSWEQKILLDEINDFNLEARYPDYKFAFYKRCTMDYTKKYLKHIKEQYKWFRSLIQ